MTDAITLNTENQSADQAEVATAKAKGTVITTVTMQDGRIVDFPGKRKMQKSSITTDGKLGVRLDFLNGETRDFYINEALLHRFAVHGAEQKLGDEIAGVDLVEDCVTAVDELIDRLYNGEWALKREPNALNGASVLAKALVQVSGKDVQTVRAYLSKLTGKEKLALRANKDVAPIIAELEANKKPKAKAAEVDTNALLDSLSNGTLAPTSTEPTAGEPVTDESVAQ